MKLYSNLSKIGVLKKYSTKFLAIAFVGIHIPLIGLILYLIFNTSALSTPTILKNMKTLANEQLTLMESTLSNLRNESQTQGKLEKANIDLKQLLDEVIESLKVPLDQKNIDVIFECDTELKTLGNVSAFRQVFTNLIGNAIKFSHSGESIRIQAKKDISGITIDVIDNGLGFKQEVSEALFKPFTEHSRLGSQGESTQGMGLFIARRFINKHFGKLTATSKGPNKGATFSIYLPVE